MVLAEPLIERMKEKEKDVKVIKVTKLDLSEVSSPILAATHSSKRSQKLGRRLTR